MRNKYCTFYLVRHGQTNWNVEEITQGQCKLPKLNKSGIKQVRDLAKKLRNIKFATIFSSDLIRAKQSAKIIALEHKINIKTTKLLRERCYGKYEGRKISDWEKELRDLIEKKSQLSKEEQFKFKFRHDVESDEEIMSRFITFLRKTAVAYPNKNVSVVTHGGIIRAFLIHLGFANYSELPRGSVINAGYIKLYSDGVDFFIKEVNGISKKVADISVKK